MSTPMKVVLDAVNTLKDEKKKIEKDTKVLSDIEEYKRSKEMELAQQEELLSNIELDVTSKSSKKKSVSDKKFEKVIERRKELVDKIRRINLEISKADEMKDNYKSIKSYQLKLIDEELERLPRDTGLLITPEIRARVENLLNRMPNGVDTKNLGLGTVENSVRLLIEKYNKPPTTTTNDWRTGKGWSRPPPPLPPRPKGGSSKWKPPVKINPNPRPNGSTPKPLTPSKDDWEPFFGQAEVVIFKDEKAINLVTIPNVTPEEFRKHFDSFDKLDTRISCFKGTTDQKVFGVTQEPGNKDSYFVGRNGATDLKDQKIVELKYTPSNDTDPSNPRPGKINIVLHDSALKDDSLYMMVVAAKDVLEKMGKEEFHITNCEDKPEIALKLFLIGKSLGLKPIFKDGMKYGAETDTHKSLVNPNPPVLLRVKGEEKSLAEIYERAKNASPAEALDLIKSLERKVISPDLSADASATAAKASASSSAVPPATHGLTAAALSEGAKGLRPFKKK